NIFDIVFDPSFSNWQDGLVIHRSYRTIEQIKNNPVYINTDEIELSDNGSVERFSLNSDMDDHNEKPDNMVKLYSAYGDFKIDDKVYYDYIAVVANDKYLIRFERNPYPEKPFIFCTYEQIPNKLYGIGAIEPGLGIQYLVNTFSNQKADVMSLIINGMWAYVDDGIIDPEEIVAKPGALIAVKDPNNIKPLHPDTTVSLSYNEIAQLKSEYQEVTGATKYFTGGPSIDFKKTATEVAALQSAGVVRFSEVIQNIEQNALKRAIKLVFAYNSAFNYSDGTTSVINNGFGPMYQYDKTIFMDAYNFRVIGANSSISRDIRVNKLIEFIKMVGSSPLVAQQVNLIELIRHLYRELGFKDENNVFLNSNNRI
ncbi:MAG: portal protein, partial [Vampirovibrionia bacterium]